MFSRSSATLATVVGKYLSETNLIFLSSQECYDVFWNIDAL